MLVSTPYMDEASLCDRIALIQGGNILSIDTPDGVIGSFRNLLLAVRSSNMLKLLNDLNEFPLVENAYPFGEYHHAVMDPVYRAEELNAFLKEKGNKELDVREVKPDIEDCFIALMKN